MHTGLHHALNRIRKNQIEKTSGLIRIIDNSAYLMGAITVAINVPQLISVWTAPNTEGVSLISWIGFSVGSLFWLIYGVLHKEKPIIVINGGLIIVQALIVFGLILR